jgi:hypothetical protein
LASAKTVYLNGVDVSSVRNTTLKNVTVVVDQKGDVYIEAPHYKVDKESTYLPLSKAGSVDKTPEHQLPTHPNLNQGSYEKVIPGTPEKVVHPTQASAPAELPPSEAVAVPVANQQQVVPSEDQADPQSEPDE